MPESGDLAGLDVGKRGQHGCEAGMHGGGLPGKKSASDGIAEQRVGQRHTLGRAGSQQAAVRQPREPAQLLLGRQPCGLLKSIRSQWPFGDPQDSGHLPRLTLELAEPEVEQVGQLPRNLAVRGAGQLVGVQRKSLSQRLDAVDDGLGRCAARSVSRS